MQSRATTLSERCANQMSIIRGHHFRRPRFRAEHAMNAHQVGRGFRLISFGAGVFGISFGVPGCVSEAAYLSCVCRCSRSKLTPGEPVPSVSRPALPGASNRITRAALLDYWPSLTSGQDYDVNTTGEQRNLTSLEILPNLVHPS